MDIAKFEKVTSAFHTINYVIPAIQRVMDLNVVRSIYDRECEFYNMHGQYVIPGTISIALYDGAEHVLDGQHRMEAYKQLSAKYPERDLFISIDRYTCDSVEALNNTYKIVNTATPNEVARMSVDVYKLKQMVSELFRTRFASYLKISAKPIPPNINLSCLQDKLELVDLSQFRLGELTDYILELNTYYANCTESQFAKWHVEVKCVGNIKQKPNQLYLGIYREYEWVDRIVQLKQMRQTDATATFDSMPHYSYSYRPKITKTLRRAVWNCPQVEQLCYCCRLTITVDDFQCGHVIPLIKGGPTVKDNLKPICSTCNYDMGVLDMNDYIRIIMEQM